MSESGGEKSLAHKAARIFAAALVAVAGTTGGSAPKEALLEKGNKTAASSDLPQSITEPAPIPVVTPEEQAKQEQRAEDKRVFIATLEKYFDLNDPKLKAELNNPLFDEQFQVVVVDKPIHSLPAHTAYTFGDIQIAIVKDVQGKVSEENLLVGKISKASLKIQPPQWEEIPPVNLNGKITSLGIRAEFSPSEGNYLRYQQSNNGQLSVAWRNTPFLK